LIAIPLAVARLAASGACLVGGGVCHLFPRHAGDDPVVLRLFRLRAGVWGARRVSRRAVFERVSLRRDRLYPKSFELCHRDCARRPLGGAEGARRGGGGARHRAARRVLAHPPAVGDPLWPQGLPERGYPVHQGHRGGQRHHRRRPDRGRQQYLLRHLRPVHAAAHCRRVLLGAGQPAADRAGAGRRLAQRAPEG
jgi:hypothetical protein